jgi:hypothetical protein
MQGRIDEMIDDALWDLRHGIWFSGPYRIILSHERQDYCLWHYDQTSKLLKRGFVTLAEAKRAAEGHRELHHAT